MKRVLVTGANKGIGLAIVTAILREQPDYGVLLGARDTGRGNAARESLLQMNSNWASRIEVLQLDVSNEESVRAAAILVAENRRDSAPLSGLVNNAGIADGDLEAVLQVNVYGMHRVCTHFTPLLSPGDRVVNITSAAGPSFVAECDPQRQQFFLDPDISWERLDAFMRKCMALRTNEFATLGMGGTSFYGLSKACANAYTLLLARTCPDLKVNSCTPGFIETDLTRKMTADSGKTPEELGMKQPVDGAGAPMFLLFGDSEGTGRYYGSDAQRSPLDRYRAPGTPAYTGK